MTWQNWLGYGAFYAGMAALVWFLFGIAAEDQHKQGHPKWVKFWATMSALWLVWPLAIAGGLLFLLGWAAYAGTRYSWSMRNGWDK